MYYLYIYNRTVEMSSTTTRQTNQPARDLDQGPL